ncbi:MAG: ABC transporter substrate-binding protein, partial [Rhodospirillales bacterium]
RLARFLGKPHGHVGDPAAAEREYFRKTGMFPIMHVIGLRLSLADGHPGLAAALFRAFVEARDLAIRELNFAAEASANRLSMPWFTAEWEATKRLMGAGVWSYGVPGNRDELETVCRYSHEQSLSRDRLSVEDLFQPETLELADGG